MTAVRTRRDTLVVLPAPAYPNRIAGYGLRWLYALVALTLIGTGAGAGQVVYMAFGLDRFRWAATCIRVYHLDHVSGVQAAGRAADQAFCVDRYNAGQGVAMVIGAVVVPALAWLCMVVGGLVVRRRIRRFSSHGAAARTVAGRFDYWCHETELVGARRPRLAVVRPGRGVAQAFTTAVPFGRPIVVVPAGYAYLPREHLDLLLLHELAHVRVRDLTWAAATWWAGWLNVPVLLLALLPLLMRQTPGLTTFGVAMVDAVALSLVTLILRAAVLRRREQAADRYAVIRGGCLAALRDAGRKAPTAHHGDPLDEPGAVAPGAFRRMVATHPTGDARVAAALREGSGWEAGFLVAVAAGVLAMFTYQCLATLFLDLTGANRMDPRLPADAAVAAAAFMWAVAVTPIWARSRSIARTARWSRVAGSTLGLVAGTYLQSPGTLVPVGVLTTGHRIWIALAWSVVPMAGASLIAVELSAAVHAVRGRRRRLTAGAAAVLGATAVLTTVTANVWELLGEHALYHDVAVERRAFVLQGETWWWAWTPLLVVLAAAVVAGLGPDVLRDARLAGGTVVAGIVAGGGVGVLVTQLRIGRVTSDDQISLLLDQRWWICGAAGAAVAVALLRRAATGSRLPVALVAGTVTAAGAGLAQYCRDLIAGRSGHGLTNLVALTRVPAWLTLSIVLVLGPVVLLVDPRPGKDRLRSGLILVAGALIVPILVATGVLAPLIGMPGDYTHFQAVARHPSAPPILPAVPRRSADAGRPLDPAAAKVAMARIRNGLPSAWTTEPNGTDSPDQDPQPKSCGDRLAADAAADQARVTTAHESVTVALPAAMLSPEGATMIITLDSTPSTDTGWSILTEQAAELAVCPQWTVADARADDGRRYQTLTAEAPPALPYPGFQERLTTAYRYHTYPLPFGVVSAWVMVGHNIVTVTVYYLAAMRETLTDPQWTMLDTMTLDTLRSAVAEL